MDWTPIEQALVSIAATVITVATPIAISYINAHVKNRALADVVQAGAGVAYTALNAASVNGSLSWEAAKSAAITKGVEAAQTLIKQDVPRVAVEGALGALLASDPSFTVSGASTATAIAMPGETALATAGPAPEENK